MKKVIIPIFLLVLVSCGHTERLTKRYKSLQILNDDKAINKYVEVNAYAIDVDDDYMDVFDLSSHGQAQFIQEVGKKTNNTDEFIEDVSKEIISAGDEENIEHYDFKKRMVISIRNNSHFPADRISKINIILDFGSEVKILNCDKLQTEYETLDLGVLNKSRNKGTNLGIDAPIMLGGITGGISTESSSSEEVALKKRKVILNASITDNKLSLYQDGISGEDLTGNILADVSFKVRDLKVEKVYSFSNLMKNKSSNKLSEVNVKETFVTYPNITKDIKVKISYQAYFRKVVKNHETISESDDYVKLYHGNVVNEIAEVVIPKQELNLGIWKISLKSDPFGIPIRINSGDLLFNSYEEVSGFLIWMKSKFDNNKKEIKIGNNHIVKMSKDFTNVNDLVILPYE